ncbi:MAG: N(5)-(carboxyethyl)ornithine synthase [Peptoniphilaceae bacterium]|nr:N(5)-(carboxyethyl)ornithine synthase [Peptoniphilaceae bacterium]MDY6018498.1 N(5)-(carboxyethyl)ornithine synthase [Anaerococcus sp.]
MKKTVGLPKSRKKNEKRRALVPRDLKEIKNVDKLYFETGYGQELGFSDQDYINMGANIGSFDQVLEKDIICDPKIGDESFLSDLKEGQTVFGWLHAVQNKDIADKLLEKKLKVYAWEDMYEDGRHVFWRNNQIAGEAAVMNAFECFGIMPYNTKVAILGRGNVASGALKILTCLGADVTIYNRHMEKLFKKELPNYDVIINAILWDVSRKDHIIYKEDLKRMKKNALIIDISCDRAGAIETSVPTTMDDPIYLVDGISHYVVDHTPSIFFKNASFGLSEEVKKYIDQLIEGNVSKTLKDALIIDEGKIIDQRIIAFQNR